MTHEKNFPEYCQDELINEYNKSEEYIHNAEEKINESLEKFYRHYIDNHYLKLIELEKEIYLFFQNLSRNFVHSIRSRVKEPYHLIDKIIRKVHKSTDYNNLTLENYHLLFDDLLGFRIILLYSDDWEKVHDFISDNIKIDPEKYLDKQNRLSVPKDAPMFIVSKPEIKIRNGDDDSIYERYKNEYKIDKGKYYRSTHYSVFHQGYCFEIQVRSIFDEAWSEVDHNILYPNHLENTDLISYSRLLNRISGAANEMSQYFKNTVSKQPYLKAAPTLDSVPDELKQAYERIVETSSVDPANSKFRTAKDANNEVIMGDLCK